MVPGRPLESRKVCPRRRLPTRRYASRRPRQPLQPEPNRGEGPSRRCHPAHEVGRTRRCRPKPAVQRDAGWTGLLDTRVRGGHLVGLATAAATHILHLDKVGLGTTSARVHSQRARNELGFGVCFETEANHGSTVIPMV